MPGGAGRGAIPTKLQQEGRASSSRICTWRVSWASKEQLNQADAGPAAGKPPLRGASGARCCCGSEAPCTARSAAAFKLSRNILPAQSKGLSPTRRACRPARGPRDRGPAAKAPGPGELPHETGGAAAGGGGEGYCQHRYTDNLIEFSHLLPLRFSLYYVAEMS